MEGPEDLHPCPPMVWNFTAHVLVASFSFLSTPLISSLPCCVPRACAVLALKGVNFAEVHEHREVRTSVELLLHAAFLLKLKTSMPGKTRQFVAVLVVTTEATKTVSRSPQSDPTLEPRLAEEADASFSTLLRLNSASPFRVRGTQKCLKSPSMTSTPLSAAIFLELSQKQFWQFLASSRSC